LIYIATNFLAPIPLISLGIIDFLSEFPPKSTDSLRRNFSKKCESAKAGPSPVKAGLLAGQLIFIHLHSLLAQLRLALAPLAATPQPRYCLATTPPPPAPVPASPPSSTPLSTNHRHRLDQLHARPTEPPTTQHHQPPRARLQLPVPAVSCPPRSGPAPSCSPHSAKRAPASARPDQPPRSPPRAGLHPPRSPPSAQLNVSRLRHCPTITSSYRSCSRPHSAST
jgi:hypothetical protein